MFWILCFFFNDTATTEIYTLSLHDALPIATLVAHEPPLMELLPDAERWRGIFDGIDQTYRSQGVFPAMGMFGAAVEEGGPKYKEEMQQTPPTPEGEEM